MRGHCSYSSFGTCEYSPLSGAAGVAVLLLQHVVVVVGLAAAGSAREKSP